MRYLDVRIRTPLIVLALCVFPASFLFSEENGTSQACNSLAINLRVANPELREWEEGWLFKKRISEVKGDAFFCRSEFENGFLELKINGEEILGYDLHRFERLSSLESLLEEVELGYFDNMIRDLDLLKTWGQLGESDLKQISDVAIREIFTLIEERRFKESMDVIVVINKNGYLDQVSKEKLEAFTLKIVSPIPRGLYHENSDGYRLLTILNPDNATYAKKLDLYEGATLGRVGKYRTGKRGGCYYVSGNGNNVYVDRAKCRL